MRTQRGKLRLVTWCVLLGSLLACAQLRPDVPQKPTRGAVRENPKDGLKYLWIPPGTFMMGCSPGDTDCSDQEKPSHQVTLSRGFWIGQTEATVAAYKRFATAEGRQMPPAPTFNDGWVNDNMPIVDINWDEANRYCGWAGGRLPTEAEWEYAARGGISEPRYGDLDEIAWYGKNSGYRTHDVAQKRANPFGLYDVVGNVWEWVSDWYDPAYYQNSPARDPMGPANAQFRVVRGGSWGCIPRLARVTFRRRYNPSYGFVTIGFRCIGEASSP